MELIRVTATSHTAGVARAIAGIVRKHHRADGVGARLSITSQPGQGTELTIHWTETPPTHRVLRKEVS